MRRGTACPCPRRACVCYLVVTAKHVFNKQTNTSVAWYVCRLQQDARSTPTTAHGVSQRWTPRGQKTAGCGCTGSITAAAEPLLRVCSRPGTTVCLLLALPPRARPCAAAWLAPTTPQSRPLHVHTAWCWGIPIDTHTKGPPPDLQTPPSSHTHTRARHHSPHSRASPNHRQHHRQTDRQHGARARVATCRPTRLPRADERHTV